MLSENNKFVKKCIETYGDEYFNKINCKHSYNKRKNTYFLGKYLMKDPCRIC